MFASSAELPRHFAGSQIAWSSHDCLKLLDDRLVPSPRFLNRLQRPVKQAELQTITRRLPEFLGPYLQNPLVIQLTRQRKKADGISQSLRKKSHKSHDLLHCPLLIRGRDAEITGRCARRIHQAESHTLLQATPACPKVPLQLQACTIVSGRQTPAR